MIDFAPSTENTQEHDVDAIIANAYGHQNPSAQESTPSQPVVENKAPSAPQYKEFEFTTGGKAVKIREDDPRFQQWLSQGHNYSQNINSFKTEQENWNKQKQAWEAQWGRYQVVDEFAKQNPDWWNHVDQSFQQRQNPIQQIPDPIKSYLEPIVKDYSMVKDFVQEYQREKIEKQNAEQDAKLGEAMKSIQDKYSNLDFNAKDESGYSLQQRVLNHAVQNGFPTFRAAFLDYYHDHLEKLAETRGKESIMQEMQKRKKLGLLDENSPTPNRSSPSLPPQNGVRPRSWNDQSLSSDAILKEFNFR